MFNWNRTIARWTWPTLVLFTHVLALGQEMLPPEVRLESVPGESEEGAVSLETALQWTLTRNPDLLAMRGGRAVSAAAWAVAQRFPMALNPTVSVEVRPWTFDGTTRAGLDTLVSVSWMQPLEFGHRRQHRMAMAQAEFSRTDWAIIHQELLALVKTYRFHQEALYRKEKLQIAQELTDFNEQLVKRLRNQVNAGQGDSADLVLAEVEHQASVQQLATARQQYLNALTLLRRQMGLPEWAGSLQPAGVLEVPQGPPSGGGDLADTAVVSHPAVQTAQAKAAASRAAVLLARAETIPSPEVGAVYESDESGTTFYGLAVSTPLHLLNRGRTIVSQREMEYRRDLSALAMLQQRIETEVRAALAKWEETSTRWNKVSKSVESVAEQVSKMEHLYAAGQTDLLKLLDVRRRLIESQNLRLDMLWELSQAYADLLESTGAVSLLGSLSPALPAETGAPLPVETGDVGQ